MKATTRSPERPSPAPQSTAPVSVKIWTVVTLLLMAFFLQNVLEMRQQSATMDEVAHLPAGYSYVVTRDFRMNPEHPPLVKVLAALPLLALHPKTMFADASW